MGREITDTFFMITGGEKVLQLKKRETRESPDITRENKGKKVKKRKRGRLLSIRLDQLAKYWNKKKQKNVSHKSWLQN